MSVDCNHGPVKLTVIALDRAFNNTVVTRQITVTSTVSLIPCSFNSGSEGGLVRALAIDPAHHNTVYAGGLDNVYTSTDSGQTWTGIAGNLVIGTVRALAVDSVNGIVYASGDEGFLKSVDGGTSWTPLPFTQRFGGGINSIAVDPTIPTTLYYGASNAGVFKSTDGGTNWTEIDSSLPPSTSVYVVAINPSSSSTVYIATVIATSGRIDKQSFEAIWRDLQPVCGRV